MNVPWGSVDVLRSAQTQLEASLVTVTMATSWMLTIRLAPVCWDMCVHVSVVCMCMCLWCVSMCLWCVFMCLWCVCVCACVCGVCACACMSMVKPFASFILIMQSPNAVMDTTTVVFVSAIDACGANAGNCDQICISTLGSYMCGCFLGFSQSGNTCTGKYWYLGLFFGSVHWRHLNKTYYCAGLIEWLMHFNINSFMIFDVYSPLLLIVINPCSFNADKDECASNGGYGPCNQTCTNTVGSFFCSCQPGYIQSGFNCIGKLKLV